MGKLGKHREVGNFRYPVESNSYQGVLFNKGQGVADRRKLKREFALAVLHLFHETGSDSELLATYLQSQEASLPNLSQSFSSLDKFTFILHSFDSCWCTETHLAFGVINEIHCQDAKCGIIVIQWLAATPPAPMIQQLLHFPLDHESSDRSIRGHSLRKYTPETACSYRISNRPKSFFAGDMSASLVNTRGTLGDTCNTSGELL